MLRNLQSACHHVFRRGYALLVGELRVLERQGALTLPAAGSWEKIGTPPLPKWVLVTRGKVIVAKEDFSLVPWVPEMGFWTELKAAQLAAAKVINGFLLRRRANFLLVPIKERSLEIFGDEKRLDAMCSGDTLFGGRLPLRVLGAFRAPLPLPYRAAEAPGRSVLVVENHNSFWNFGEWNHTAKHYAAIVYGAGEAFRSTGRALQQVLHEVDGSDTEYLGDLDPKGIRIPCDFNRASEPASPRVRPALSLYAWLLSNGVRRHKPECATFDHTLTEGWLGAELMPVVTEMWQAGQWIPQEALGLEQLMAMRPFPRR